MLEVFVESETHTRDVLFGAKYEWFKVMFSSIRSGEVMLTKDPST